MKFLSDLHTHTIASVHAYSTVQENILAAKQRGLIVIGISDHGYGMHDTTSPDYFMNIQAIPRHQEGIRVLVGVEANIWDYDGLLYEQEILDKLDYVIASLHPNCIKPGTKEENTAAIIGAIKNPYVNIIGHLDDSRYPVDYEAIVRTAAEHNVVLEVNNSSHKKGTYRINAHENTVQYMSLCREMGAKIIFNSDAHYSMHVGSFDESIPLIEESKFPKENIINFSKKHILDLLKIDL